MVESFPGDEPGETVYIFSYGDNTEPAKNLEIKFGNHKNGLGIQSFKVSNARYKVTLCGVDFHVGDPMSKLRAHPNYVAEMENDGLFYVYLNEWMDTPVMVTLDRQGNIELFDLNPPL